ncbi:VOC family protein [Streptomyces nanshensis]|uniref:Hydroxylase n=1 Tax=Streptomyces nanshensis TaxID=518642 RepID=A0A1E7L4B2_9ACTN|nr:VOC family protein [Streptomyces nanshensis]OEV11019.1 hydroxylase [Streptomyces nanshensis]
MITTDYSVGSPCWLDLGVRDSAAAKRFYGGVFGWTFQPFGSGEEEFGFFKSDGKTVAALGPLDEGARSSWMIYFSTPDLDAAAQQVRQAGGSVRVDPFDVNDQGRMAQFTDPQGGQFAAWQPGKTAGLETVDEPGALMWVELYTTDSERAKEFYETLYGWDYTDMPMPGDEPGDEPGTYTIIGPSGAPQERMHGGLMQVPPDALALAGGTPFWHPVFHTNDCDATIAKVTELGGKVVMGPEDAEGVGRMAVCLDPFGADFVVLRPSM